MSDATAPRGAGTTAPSGTPAATGPAKSATPRKAPKKKRAGPGRPEGVSTIRDEILDAAEVEFAEQGYAGTSLRTVAERAQVTQALINYYFGSKHGLFKEAFLRRGHEIAEARTRRLEALRAGGARPAVRDILNAFLEPALAMRGTPGGRVFMRLHARLHTEPPDISYELRSAAYDRSTHLFAEALAEALPHLSKRDVYWRLTLMVGAYLYAFSDTHRLEVMAPRICDPDDADEVMAAITSFVTGGMLAPGPDAPEPSERTRAAPSRDA